jgi:hypothetical protein
MVRSVLWSTAVASCVAILGVVSACAKSSDGEAGQGVCASSGSCANDPTLSQSAIDTCNTQISGTCGSEYSDYFACLKANATCSSGGTSVPPPASTCESESGSLSACMAGGSSGTDSGSSGTDSGTSTFDSGGQTFDTGTSVDTGTTTGSCAGDEFQFPTAACQTCVDSMCCSDVTACSGDPTCGSLVTCISNCAQGDQTCANTCGSMYSSAVTEYNNLGMCVMSGCTTACGG